MSHAGASDEIAFATVNHELRTALTSIVGYAELLLDGVGGELTDGQVQMVDAIRRNSERLAAQANDLIVLSAPGYLQAGRFRE